MDPRRFLASAALTVLAAAACSEEPITETSATRGSPPPDAVINAGTRYYVSPGGSAGNTGLTQGSPWTLARSLQSGFSTPAPGDTVYLMDGTYSGNFTGNRPGVVYRQLSTPFGAAKINGTIRMNGADIVLWGFTVLRSTATNDNLPGVEARGARQKYINLIIHDAMQQGITFWDEAVDSEVYGCIVYNNGWEHNLDHGIYIHNNSGTKLIAQNVFFNNVAYGVHAYAGPGDAVQRDIHVLNNVSFNNGTIVPGATYSGRPNIFIGDEVGGATGMIVRENYVYHQRINGGYGILMGFEDNVGSSMTVDYNRIFGGKIGLKIMAWGSTEVRENQIGGSGDTVVWLEDPTPDTSWTGHDFFHTAEHAGWYWSSNGALTFSQWQSATGLGTGTPPDAIYGPTGDWWNTHAVAFPANQYEHGRGIIVVWNEGAALNVPVSLANFLNSGETYKIYNVFDLVTPVLTGTYGGGTISLPLSEEPPPTPFPSRNGTATGAGTGTFFFTFIVTKG